MSTSTTGSVLVTGGSGFVGHHLVRECVRRGMSTRVLVRPTSRTEGLEDVELATGDLATGAGLREAVAGVEVVFHLAGAVKALRPDDFFEVNARGTARLVRACRAARPRPRRLVLVSSQAAAGPSRFGRPRAETDPERPVSWYGRSKLAAERALVEAGGELETVVVRPPAVYGPRDRENAAFLQTLSAGLALSFRGALERLSLVEVSDLVGGILLAADVPEARGRTYFLCHPEVLSGREMMGRMAEALGVEPRHLTLPGGVVRIAGGLSHLYGALIGQARMLSLWKVPELLARDWSCSPERARREIGFSPRLSAERGVPAYVRWWCEETGRSRASGPGTV